MSVAPGDPCHIDDTIDFTEQTPFSAYISITAIPYLVNGIIYLPPRFVNNHLTPAM